MRLFCFLLIASTAITSGCASLIAKCGKDLEPFKTREQIHEQLGEPTKKGEDNGLAYEEFTTRQKIAEKMVHRYSVGYAMMWYFTLGTIDVVCVPCELIGISYGTIFGNTIRVMYDPSGKVKYISVNGEELLDIFISYREESTPQKPNHTPLDVPLKP